MNPNHFGIRKLLSCIGRGALCAMSLFKKHLKKDSSQIPSDTFITCNVHIVLEPTDAAVMRVR